MAASLWHLDVRAGDTLAMGGQTASRERREGREERKWKIEGRR